MLETILDELSGQVTTLELRMTHAVDHSFVWLATIEESSYGCGSTAAEAVLNAVDDWNKSHDDGITIHAEAR